MTAPWLDDGDVQLYHGDACDVLRSLPAGSVQTCVTSPPYWGLRDYGNEGQIGLEDSPDDYVSSLVAVLAGVARVLRDDGTLWLNLGDSYGHGATTRSTYNKRGFLPKDRDIENLDPPRIGQLAKQLIGIPWKVGFALQEAGWYLRSDIVWAKPNPMPESVTDRPTKAHEYVFLLAKQPRYYYDADAIRERSDVDWGKSQRTTDTYDTAERYGAGNGGNSGLDALAARMRSGDHAGRNARSVWEIATQPTPEAHFATFPEALVRRCILAGTSERGGCSVCGAPWQRVVERTPMEIDRSERTHDRGHTRSSGTMTKPPTSETTGWAASCQCGAPPVPQTVLDPFVGSGTTALVARKHGRRAIGIDLSADYLAIAARRLGQQSLFATSEGAA